MARIKQVPEDFVVKEVLRDGYVCDIKGRAEYPSKEGDFAHCLLWKRDYDTFKAIRAVAKALSVPPAAISYAGTKDKRAVSCQRVSVRTSKRVKTLELEDIRLKPIGRGGPVFLGDLAGNMFTIVIRDIEEEDFRKKLKTLEKERFIFPNYFGPQRFGGDEGTTYRVGRAIVNGDFKEAVSLYVGEKALQNPGKALEGLPKSKTYERVMLNSLVRKPVDYKAAITSLPTGLRRMFVHAYQSFLFNNVLDALLKKGRVDEALEIPLFGHGMKLPKERRVLEAMRKVLRKERLDLSKFRVEDIPELASKGGRRKAFARAGGFRVLSLEDDELNKGKKKAVLRFCLPKGCYATVFLREILRLNL